MAPGAVRQAGPYASRALFELGSGSHAGEDLRQRYCRFEQLWAKSGPNVDARYVERIPSRRGCEPAVEAESKLYAAVQKNPLSCTGERVSISDGVGEPSHLDPKLFGQPTSAASDLLSLPRVREAGEHRMCDGVAANRHAGRLELAGHLPCHP